MWQYLAVILGREEPSILHLNWGSWVQTSSSKTGQFQMVRIWMVGTIALAKAQLYDNRAIWNLFWVTLTLFGLVVNTLGTRFPKYTGNIVWAYLWVVGTKSNLEKVQIQMESCASVWIGWSICFYFSHNFFLLTLFCFFILTLLSSILELHFQAYQMWGTAVLVEWLSPGLLLFSKKLIPLETG